MELSPEQVILFLIGLLGALVVSAHVLRWLVKQKRQGQDVLPYQPRRLVPWQGGHVLGLSLLFIFSPSFVGWLWQAAGLPLPLAENAQKIPSEDHSIPPLDLPPPPNPSEDDLTHHIEQLLRQTRGIGIWLPAVLMTLVGAPVVEEWLFRAVFQGWLEKLDRRLFCTIRRIRWPKRSMAAQRFPVPSPFSWGGWLSRRLLGVGPVAVSSLVFAGLHFRTAGPTIPPSELLMMFIWQGIGYLITLVGGVAFLAISCGARPADFGLCWSEASQDIRRGLIAYLLVIGPIYLVMVFTRILLIQAGASEIAPDPVPLFVLALVLGGLYFRSHRLLPCVVLHMAFNATGLVLFLLFFAG